MFPESSAPMSAAIWREVSRHLEAQEATSGLLQAIRRFLPVTGLLVRRWTDERSHLDTVASAGVPGGLALRTNVPTPWRRELLALGGLRAWQSRGETGLGRLVVPEGIDGAVAAGPLREEGHLIGVLVVVAPGSRVPPGLEELLEPFATVLANDARVHLLARLRESAAQDRASLLERIDRPSFGDDLVGATGGLTAVMARVVQVAPTDAPVLLLGETGSGKEVVAREIHRRSRRAEGPFLRVNCGAVPLELVDSELFGHEKGAFTGALAMRRGWFERADGGTLLLDEIGELPLSAQVRLLRVLQDGSFQRVGGEQVRSADVRILAATHRDLRAMVRDGSFRQDLWYRMSVFPVDIPPLRSRRADIPAFVHHFSERAGRRIFGRPLAPHAEDLDRLSALHWPGNVRELQGVVERAVILGGGERLDVAAALAGHTAEALPEDEVAAIHMALERCRGRIEGPFGAAVSLGVNPHTLRSRMRRLGIDWASVRRKGAV